MNILFLDQISLLGGAQRCLLDLLPAVEERGWTARAAIPPGGPLVEILRERGMRVDEIRCGTYRSSRKYARDVLQFAADLPRQAAAIPELMEGADLVYVNGPRLLVGAALAVKRRVPLLFHAHHRVSQGSARYLERWALRRSGGIVAACCEAVGQTLRGSVPAECIHVVPNGTEDLGFVERSFEKGRERRVGIIGRIAPEKGQLELLRAAAHVSGARFVVCGGPLFGDRRYYDDVRRLASGLPVEFLDWQSDVASVMRNLDVLAMPSKVEGMPRVLLEAFSSGLPVVAFPVDGIPEVIEDRVTGFLAVDLAKTLREVVEADPETLRAVARNARRKWEARYTLPLYRERITDVMAQCVPRAALERAVPRQWAGSRRV
ncbi:MAG TPA: glycosyltransferase family 4 protein [Bryobacteraceae bacterium]|nr:glycosyltransferase family 4 protein [Bryobacteraceae bacterium]